MTKLRCFVKINNVGDKMKYSLTYLKQHQSEGINLEIDFSKELNLLTDVKKISKCVVKGNYSIVDYDYVRFSLTVSAVVTFIAADTLKEIDREINVIINDDVSFDTEYKIINEMIDLYELVWGWFVAEIPLIVYEKEEE